MKKLFSIFFLLPLFIQAQQKNLFVQGVSPQLYLVHTTAAKESFYSISRLYNIPPKDIATYNKLTLEKGLTIGKVIRIPLSETNFIQSVKAEEGEALIPLYYTVKPKETLFHISTTHNKLAIADLKSWNNLKSDAVTAGANLVVGYLKVKKDQSPLAKNASTPTPIPVVEHALDKPKDDAPSQPVQEEPVKKPAEPKAQMAAVIKQEVPSDPGSSLSQPDLNDGGIFRDLYKGNEQKTQNGLAGTFKSTSGWEDKKYYCLHNSAAPGTIIKITNVANQRFIYAKVLDVIPNTKSGADLIVRISNAAADALLADGSNFDCIINY